MQNSKNDYSKILIEGLRKEFNERAISYDEKHLASLTGGRESKDAISLYLNEDTKTIADYGCGTGIELEKIFERFPDIHITGIDLSDKMLEKLSEKYEEKKDNLTIFAGNYFDFEADLESFDSVISSMSFHHFNHNEKKILYKKIFDSIRHGGSFILCDYMVFTKEEEFYYEYQKQRTLERLKDSSKETLEKLHCDIPLEISHEFRLMIEAGFFEPKIVYANKNIIIIKAEK